jgi:hypothetical protein
MTDFQLHPTRRSLATPRAAAVAGILFALLYSASVTLIRLAIPEESTADSGVWLETNARAISLALNLVPYAGIAFLWFIGVIRDRLGDVEDRFFATIFLGSGLLFLALTFTGAALAGGLLSSYAAAPDTIIEGDVFTYGREVMFQVTNVYAIRMAGVFMMTLGTIWLRSGVMHRGWAFLTYASALVLLVSISFSLWVTLIFPIWVLAVSVYFLLLSRHSQAGHAGNDRSTS